MDLHSSSHAASSRSQQDSRMFLLWSPAVQWDLLRNVNSSVQKLELGGYRVEPVSSELNMNVFGLREAQMIRAAPPRQRTRTAHLLLRPFKRRSNSCEPAGVKKYIYIQSINDLNWLWINRKTNGVDVLMTSRVPLFTCKFAFMNIKFSSCD